MWDNNNYTMNKKRPNPQIEGISVNKKQYHQPSFVANALNNHFCDAPLTWQLPCLNPTAATNHI